MSFPSPVFTIRNESSDLILTVSSSIPEANGPIEQDIGAGQEVVFLSFPTSTTLFFTKKRLDHSGAYKIPKGQPE